MRSVIKKQVYTDGGEKLAGEVTVDPDEYVPSELSHTQGRRKSCRWKGLVRGVFLTMIPNAIT